MNKVKWGVLGTAGIAKGCTIPGMLLADSTATIPCVSITLADAQSILDYITGEAAEDELDLKAADMDGDEAVTSKDAQLLLEFTPEGYKSNYIVPANGKAEVTVYIDITEDLSNYPSGAYIEGYTYANCITDTKEGVSFEHSHSIPILGFYGSWTDASMFDKFSYYDGLEISELMGDDPDEYTDLYTYTGNWMTNFMTIKSDGQVLPFIGNPYKVEEEGFPYDRLAISSDTEITDFYYNLIRPAGTLGYAVSSLDKDNNITEVLDASVTGYQDTGEDQKAKAKRTKNSLGNSNEEKRSTSKG